MGPLWRMIVKEFLQLRQDRKMIPVLVIGPLFQLLALGYAANLDVTAVPLLLVDEDRSAPSRDLSDRFVSSGYFRLVGSATTAAEIEPWLLAGRAQVALVIAPGYGAAALGGGRPRVQVIVDGTDANSALVGMGYAGRILGGVGTRLLATTRTVGAAVGAGRLELRPRVLYNPDLKSRWFYVPAVLAMVLMLVTLILPSMAVVREKELGTLEQIIATPLRPWQIVLGKLLPFMLVGLLDTLLIAGLIRFVFGVPLNGSLWVLLLLTLLFLLSTLGLGLLVSTLVRTQQQAMMFAIFAIMVPMIYLSGLLFPIENMPQPLQWATYVIPVRYYASVIRGVFLKGSGLDVLWPEALALSSFGLMVLALAASRFRKNLD